MPTTTTDALSLAHTEDMPTEGPWTLVRRALGIDAFGVNLVEIAPGEQIPAHDEIESDQEELYAVLSGSAVAVVDGAEYPAPAGTYLRIAPSAHRTVANRASDPVTLLVVGAPRSSGFAPMDWC